MDKFSAHDAKLALPQNIEAEEAILGGILIDPEAMDRIIDLIVPEAFSIEAHRTIYKAALALNNQSKPTDLMSVATWLNDRQLLEKVGGQIKLAQLVARTVSAVNIDRYANLVTEKYLRRNLIRAGHKIIDLGYQTSTELPLVLDEAEAAVFAVSQVQSSSDVEPIASIAVRNFTEMEEYAKGSGTPAYNTGLRELDRLLGGLKRQELMVLGGRPSMGKTGFGIFLAYTIALLHQKPAVIFSLEMSKEQLTYRLLSPIARIEYQRLMAGRISQGEWEAIAIALGELSDLPIFIDDTTNINPTKIRSKLRRLVASGNSPALVLVDYLQMMRLLKEGNSGNLVQELNTITAELKNIAKEFDCSVIALSQLHRGVESRQDKRPLMSDLRESGAIEQAADVVCLFYRDDYYNNDSPDKGIVEINLAKNRNGPTGIVQLLFEKQFNRFLDIYYQMS